MLIIDVDEQHVSEGAWTSSAGLRPGVWCHVGGIEWSTGVPTSVGAGALLFLKISADFRVLKFLVDVYVIEILLSPVRFAEPRQIG